MKATAEIIIKNERGDEVARWTFEDLHTIDTGNGPLTPHQRADLQYIPLGVYPRLSARITLTGNLKEPNA
jgi:hypothetical protein